MNIYDSRLTFIKGCIQCSLIIICSCIIGCGNNDKLKIINESVYSPDIDGFMGIKWGESEISVKQKIISREESPKIDTMSTPFYLKVNNIKFADRRIAGTYESCNFRFCSKGFYSGACFMDGESEDFPKKLKSLIIEKHGQPWKGNNDKDSFFWRTRDNNTIYLSWNRSRIFSDRNYFIVISYKNVTGEAECKALNEDAKYKKMEQERLQREEMEKKKHIKKDL